MQVYIFSILLFILKSGNTAHRQTHT